MVKKDFMPTVVSELEGGRGKGAMVHWLEDDELCDNLSLLSTVTLERGATVGVHTHTGEAEIYRIIAGKGLYIDNGEEVEVVQGDVMLCRDGESHGIDNIGSEELTFDAIIIKK